MFRRARLSPGWSTHVSAERSSKRYPGRSAPEAVPSCARNRTSDSLKQVGPSVCPWVSHPESLCVCVSEPTDRQGNRLIVPNRSGLLAFCVLM